MKHSVRIGFLSILFSLSTIASSKAGDVLVGFVDIQKIITTVKEGQTVMKTLQKSFEDKKVKLDKLKAEVQKLQEQYKKNSAVMNDKTKATLGQDIQAKMMEAESKTLDAQKDINQQEQELKKPIIEKLKTIIEDISKENKVAMTFELSSAPVVYVENKKDLTEEVIKAYDKKHSK